MVTINDFIAGAHYAVEAAALALPVLKLAALAAYVVIASLFVLEAREALRLAASPARRRW